MTLPRYLRSLRLGSDLQKSIAPAGWKPGVNYPMDNRSMSVSFSHPEHGVVSINKNPESNHFEVKHNGAYAGLKGNKGIYPDVRQALQHAHNYLSALGQNKVAGKQMANVPSAGATGLQRPQMAKDQTAETPKGDPKGGQDNYQVGMPGSVGQRVTQWAQGLISGNNQKAERYLRTLRKNQTVVSPQKNAYALHEDVLDTSGNQVGGTVRDGSMYGELQGASSGYKAGTERFHYMSLVFDIDGIREHFGKGAENSTVRCTSDWSKGITIDRQAAMKSASDKPVIIATLPLDSGHKLLLIDGHHRMYRACQHGKSELPANILTPEDTMKFMEAPPDLMAKMWSNVKKTVAKSESGQKSGQVSRSSSQILKPSELAKSVLRNLRKDDKSSNQGGYLESYLKTARGQLERRLATNEDAVNDIKHKYHGPEQKQRLAAHDRMVKYWKEAVQVAERVNRGKHATEPPPIKISKDNAKLKKDGIVSFNIPAGHACPGKGECFGPCYALVGPQSWPAAIGVRSDNWAAAEREDFAPRMIDELKKFPKGQRVRVHDSGDFYDQHYIDKWHAIASAHPDKNFYAYTKALNLDWKKLAALPNFNIVQSVGGVHDRAIDPNQPHAFIFPSEDEMKRNGYIDTNSSDLPAVDKKNTKIGLVIHGSRAAQLDPATFGQRFSGSVQIQDPTLKPKAKKPDTKKSEDFAKSGYVPEEVKVDQPDHFHQAQEHARKADPARRLKLMHMSRLLRLT